MNDMQKIELVTTHLTERHLEMYGGYPKPARWFGDLFVYVETQGDSDKYDEIRAYREADLVAWANRAIVFVAEQGPEFPDHYEASVIGALFEVDFPPEVPEEVSA